MVFTNEPGCYFIKALLQDAYNNPKQNIYLNKTLIESRFINFGGVRLEDVIVVTGNGVQNLTTAPRTVNEVNHVRGGGKW